MPSVLAIRHVEFEDLGTLEPVLREQGYSVRYLTAGTDVISAQDVLDVELLIVLGGPIGVQDAARYPFLTGELAAIGTRLAAHRPTFGICLGAQLMAHGLGAEVAATGRTEIGYAALTLTDAGAISPLRHLAGVPVLHWHGDAFSIPQGAKRLAETPGFPNQAFSAGPTILGLQFHIEADPRAIERWLIGHAHELATAGIEPGIVRDDAALHGARLVSAARKVFGEWLDAVDAATVQPETRR